jgi:hypothetical protein
MSRIYENQNQPLYEALMDICAEARGTNERLDRIVELLQQLAGREHTGNE